MGYMEYMHACLVEKDLVKAGQIQYQWSVDQHNGVDELDGSYCFIEGHCTNEAVTNATTLEESYQMCDDRFGHRSWTEFGQLPSFMRFQQLQQQGTRNPAGGFHDTLL